MSDDQAFREAFERGSIAPSAFDHRAHVRLAYVYLREHGVDEAERLMTAALLGFIRRHGVAESKFHATMTRAWVMAVRHFMERTGQTGSFDEFIARGGELLDPKIMLTHYSAGALFSVEARAGWVAPDLQPIPPDGSRR